MKKDDKVFIENYVNFLEKTIGIIAVMRLAIDPYPVLLMDEEILLRCFDSMTEAYKNEFVETKETESVDKAGWIVRKISELGGYENVGDYVKADVFGFDIADVSGSIRLFSDVMKRLGTKLDGDELYEEFQRIYDNNIVNKTLDEEKVENTMVRSKVRR